MRLKWVLVTVGLTLFAFLTGANGPLGEAVFGWRPAAGAPEPTAAQLPFFIVLALAEAVAFGFGVAFLLFGYPWMRAAGPAPGGLTRAAHVSIAWVLLNWWSHDSFHFANGLNLDGLLVIEYAYHVTLMVAGAVTAAWFSAVVRSYRMAAGRGMAWSATTEAVARVATAGVG